MNVLCVDKTGTLTEAKISLAMHIDSEGRPSQALLEYAYINAHFQSGVRSPLDAAILQAGKGINVSAWTRHDELAFDFSRRCLSVSARRDNETILITKGAPEAILARTVAAEVDVASLTNSGLAAQVKGTSLFARVDPEQKKRVIEALRQHGHIVGFLGDGVNDAPAIHAAHVGLSVEGATEVARAAADMILLAADLSVLADGVREGRRTLANILKYVRMGASSNFGNMLSMALASVVLPFLPLLDG